MKWNTTWLLLTLAVALFAFLWLVERHTRATATGGEPPPRLVPVRAADVTSVQIHRTNQFILRAERTNQTWNLIAPIFYPARTFAIQALLQSIEELTGYARISAEEGASRRRTLADYGLDVPQATLALMHDGQRTELLFGAKTPVGDQVYVQLLTAPSIYLVPTELLDRLPRTLNDWRDTALVNLGDLALDRFEVRTATRGFAIHVDATNNLFYLSKPFLARADRAKVEALLRKVETARVSEFVTDNPKVELEPYGLQPPEAEIAFGQGTNDLVVVQFGRSPTNDPSLVYARRLSQTNIVLLPKSVLETVQTSHAELRDRRLLAFALSAVDRIEISAEDRFALVRQTNGAWVIERTPGELADADAVRECLQALGRLEAGVEKDVVTDFAPYGLTKPSRQYLLQTVTTNASGTTNRLLAQLDIGARDGDKIFARRPDESTLYVITLGDDAQLPQAAWQFRDRRVWSFTTNQVSRVTVHQHGYTRELLREGPADWKLASGSQGVINPLAIEETVYRLGELRALYWVERDDRNKAAYGFNGTGLQLTIELKAGDKPQTLRLEFAAPAEGQLPLALATIEGQSWIFKFPPKLFFELLRDLSNPPPKV